MPNASRHGSRKFVHPVCLDPLTRRILLVQRRTPAGHYWTVPKVTVRSGVTYRRAAAHFLKRRLRLAPLRIAPLPSSDDCSPSTMWKSAGTSSSYSPRPALGRTSPAGCWDRLLAGGQSPHSNASKSRSTRRSCSISWTATGMAGFPTVRSPSSDLFGPPRRRKRLWRLHRFTPSSSQPVGVFRSRRRPPSPAAVGPIRPARRWRQGPAATSRGVRFPRASRSCAAVRYRPPSSG